jgi:hypothetical protein
MDGFELYRKIKEIEHSAIICFLTVDEFYYKEFGTKEYTLFEKELFIRKSIENEELIKEIKCLILK